MRIPALEELEGHEALNDFQRQAWSELKKAFEPIDERKIEQDRCRVAMTSHGHIEIDVYPANPDLFNVKIEIGEDRVTVHLDPNDTDVHLGPYPWGDEDEPPEAAMPDHLIKQQTRDLVDLFSGKIKLIIRLHQLFGLIDTWGLYQLEDGEWKSRQTGWWCPSKRCKRSVWSKPVERFCKLY